MAKAPGSYAPDGSVYATLASASAGTKDKGVKAPDGSTYTTKAS